MTRMIEWSVSSAALLAVLIALRQVLKGKISLRLQYALWTLALLRLLIPFSFGSTAFSVQNALPQQQMRDLPYTAESTYFAYRSQETITTDTESRTYDLPRQWTEFHTNRAELEQSGEKWSLSTYAEVITLKDLALMIWIIGMAAVALCLLGSNLRFGIRLRRSRKLLTNGEALPVYLTGEADTPCLFGLFRPAIYVTPEAAEDPARLRHVIEHELTHYRHGDQYWSLLRGVCLILHWYDPLAWWAAFLSRRDGELACDEATIRRLGEGERAAYGRTLIDMTCHKRPALLVTATTMTGGKGGIRERIRLIAKKPRTAAAALIALLLIAAVAVGCTFTGAKEKETPEPADAPATAAPSPEPTTLPEDASLYDRFFAEAVPGDLSWTLTDADGGRLSGSWAADPFPLPPLEGVNWTETDASKLDPQLETPGLIRWELRITDERRDASVVFCGQDSYPMALMICTVGDQRQVYTSPVGEDMGPYAAYFNDAVNQARMAVVGNREVPHSAFFLPTDAAEPETVAHEYAGAYVGQFIKAILGNPYKAYDAVVDTRVMEIREDGEAFIFQAYIGFTPAEPERFGAVIGAGNGGWNEEQQRFYVWRYFCLEKTEGGWTGVDLDVLNYYSEYTAVYGDYFASVPGPKADEAIHRAVMEFNRGNYKSGEFACESHVLVAKESAPGSGETKVETYYLMVLYKEYDWVEGAPKEVSGSYIPSALTFEVSPEGAYTLLEYWTPRDGSYWDDLRSKFPADVPDEDLDTQNPKYLERVHASCDAQARAYFAASKEPTEEWFIEAALPYARDYAAANGRLLSTEGAVVSRYADGKGADVVFPCAPGKRFSVSVSFAKGEDGAWSVLPKGAVNFITNHWENALVYMDMGDQKVPDAVADYAIDTAFLELEYLEQDCGYVFDDARITAITRIDTGTVGLWEGYELYRLEWRFLPAADQEIVLAGGMTMEDGYLTEWGSGGQPYILMGWKESNGVQTWERICVTNTDVIETEYGTPEMLEKYGNAYTAAAMELPARVRGRQSLLDARGFSILSASSSPLGVGQDWAEAFAQRFTQAREDDPCYCRSMEVRSCELYAESLLSEPKTFVYTMHFACDPADETSFYSQLADWGQDEVHPDWLSFRWFVVLEAASDGWRCVQAGTGGYGSWGYVNYSWDVYELLDRITTEQVGGEDALMLLPLIDWADFGRQYKFGEETWNTLVHKLDEACVGKGRVYDARQSLLWSDVYVCDQIYRDKYVILGFLHADAAYSEGLASLMAKQYDYDPVSFEQCMAQFLTEEQIEYIRLCIENERVGELYSPLNDAQLRFYDGEGRQLLPSGNWYDLGKAASIAVTWTGETPSGVRLLYTPAGTQTYDQTRLVAQRPLTREEVEQREARFEVSELDIAGIYGHLSPELDYGSILFHGTTYNVYYEAESVTLNRTDITLSRSGESYTLQATVTPSDTGRSVHWSSGDPEIAQVDEHGTVTAVNNGRTTVRAYAGGAWAECIVRVNIISREGEETETVTAVLHIYDAPTLENREPKGIRSIDLSSTRSAEAEAINELKAIIDSIRFWTDDYMVDRVKFSWDGDIGFSDREFVYYFSFDKRTIFYDHFFAQISKKDMEYIRSLAAE